MRQKDVPQDLGMADGLNEVCYAVDDEGRYILASSKGWEPKNIANSQAWEELQRALAVVEKDVRDGRLSPLAYHMAKNLMNVKLLATYMGIARWRVRRHLKPKVFSRLNHEMLNRYAGLLKISVAELQSLPPESGVIVHE